MFIFLKDFLQKIESCVEPFLQNLDPSLFQSVILGILMILIFVGEQIFTEAKTQKGRGEFSKMVIFYEILNIVFIPILAVFALVIFAFFKDDLNGHNIENSIKISAFLLLIIFVFFLLRPIFKFQEFFRGKRYKFEVSFLKKLNFSKILKFRNKTKSEKMVRAWNSFWSEKSEFNERGFTKIFISHIDDAIEYKKINLSIQLAQTYLNNIEKRNSSLVGYEIFPKVFEWNEKLWNNQQTWLKNYNFKKKNQDFFSQKYFPTFRTLSLNIFKKFYTQEDYLWNWHYFQQGFFQGIIKVLLKGGHGPYQLFSCFKKHIEESETKLNKISNEDQKQKYWRYIAELFASFCPTFFENINSAPLKYDIWEHDFPKEWKITMSNIKNKTPRIILREFLQWSQERIFKENDNSDFDKDLTEAINGIFPNVHSSLFTAFLMLFFSTEIKYALEKEPNFYLLELSVSLSGSIDEDKKSIDQRIAKMFQEKEISQKEETIQIINNYFYPWPIRFPIYKDNLSEDEFKSWNSFTEEKRKLIVKRVRKEKLEKIKEEIESAEIEKICKESKTKETKRINFLKLVTLLINKIENK